MRKTTRERKISKSEQTSDVLRQIFGYQYIPHFTGSPHEGTYLDDAELILHELAHQTLLPPEFVFTPGKMQKANEITSIYIDTLPKWRRDLTEMRAVAVELVAARLLGLRLHVNRIIDNSRRNTELLRDRHYEVRYATWVRRLMKRDYISMHAETIVAMVEGVREKGLQPWTLSVSSRSSTPTASSSRTKKAPSPMTASAAPSGSPSR